MKLAPLVPKPKPRIVGNHARQSKPKATAAAALREPDVDESESLAEESSEGEMGSVSVLADHRRPQSSTGGFERLPTRELFQRGVMAKLVVGDVDDPLEHEADAIADRVMRMPLPGPVDEGAAIEPSRGPESTLQRACCSSCSCVDEDDEELRREPAAGQRGGGASEEFTARLHARLGRGGGPLSLHARNFLEPRLGVDLGHVRTHADADAGALAQRVHARAFTLGQDIFFAPGELRPHTEAGMRLIAHEVAHTLQSPNRIHRAPETSESLSAAIESVDTGADLLEQDDKLFNAVDSIRARLLPIIDVLIEGEEANWLQDAGVSDSLRRKTESSVKRYKKISRYLESRESVESVLMVQWLDAAIEVIELLRKCVRFIIATDEYGGEAASEYGDSLRSLARRAKKLREHEFFQEGAAIEAVLRPLEEAQARVDREAEIKRQLDLVRSEMVGYWAWQPLEDIQKEHARLTSKLFAQGGRSTTGVLEVQIEVLADLIDPSNFESGGSIHDRAQALVATVKRDINVGAQAIAKVLEDGTESANELTIVIDAFRWVKFNEGDGRSERLAPLVLMSLKDPVGTLGKLYGDEYGDTVIGWLSPPSRPDLQFALLVIWAAPIAGGRSPSVPITELRTFSESARPKAVITATSMLMGSGSLPYYAESSGHRHLLAEMAWQLWADGFSYKYVATGDALAKALAPVRGADASNVVQITGEELEIDRESQGDDLEVRVDGGSDTIVVRPTNVVSLANDDGTSVLVPAMKLLELEARGARNWALWAGQELAHSAGETAEITGDWLERRAKARLDWAEKKLASSVEDAYAFVNENVPAEYQGYAHAIVSGLETAGNAVLTGATAVEGFRVGVQRGAIETVTGGVAIVGGGLAAAGEIGTDIGEGDLFEDLGVEYKQAEDTIRVTIDAAPEIAEAYYEQVKKQFQEADGRDKVFMISKGTGRVVFEVALSVAGGGATKVGKIDELADASKLGDLADAGKINARSDEARELAKRGLDRSARHADDVDLGHRTYADADLLRKVEADLPAGTEVWIDRRLDPGEVRVEYDAPNGIVDRKSVRIVTGHPPDANWVRAHAVTVVSVQKYGGLQGRIRKLVAQLRKTFLGVDDGAGSPLWEAKLEVEKFDKRMDELLPQLGTAPPGSAQARNVETELESVADQFEQWARVANGEISPGEARGFIAGKKHKKDRKRDSADSHRLSDPEKIGDTPEKLDGDGPSAQHSEAGGAQSWAINDDGIPILPDDLAGVEPLFAGRNKEAFVHNGDKNLLILRHRLGGVDSLRALQREKELLEKIRDAGFDVPGDLRIVEVRGNPALIVEKIDGYFSKKIIDRSSGKPRIKNDAMHREIHKNQRILDALEETQAKLQENGIDDLQFFMTKEGKIVIIDPRAFNPGSPIDANEKLIQALLKPPTRPKEKSRGGARKIQEDDEY